MPITLSELAMMTLRDPAGAARLLLGLGLGRDVLWPALILVAALNALVFALSGMIFDPALPLPTFLTTPLIYFVFVFMGLALTVYGLFFVGRAFGGKASLEDVMVVVTWLQALRFAVQLVVFVASLVLPALAALLVLVAAFVALYIFVHFINEAHRLGSIGRAIVVLIASAFAIAFGLSILISLLVGPFTGASGYV